MDMDEPGVLRELERCRAELAQFSAALADVTATSDAQKQELSQLRAQAGDLRTRNAVLERAGRASMPMVVFPWKKSAPQQKAAVADLLEEAEQAAKAELAALEAQHRGQIFALKDTLQVVMAERDSLQQSLHEDSAQRALRGKQLAALAAEGSGDAQSDLCWQLNTELQVAVDQVKELTRQLDEAQTKLTEATEELHEKSSRLEQTETSVGGFVARMASLETELNNLHSDSEEQQRHAQDQVAEKSADLAHAMHQIKALTELCARRQEMVEDTQAALDRTRLDKQAMEQEHDQIESLTEEIRQLHEALENAESEKKAADRKWASKVKDLQKQLEKESRGFLSAFVTPSPTSASSPASAAASVSASTLARDNEELIQRLANSQTMYWSLEEEFRVTSNRLQTCERELAAKSDLLQGYIVRDASLTTVPAAKSPISTSTDPVLLVEMNRRLQGMLVDLATKNEILKKKLDSLYQDKYRRILSPAPPPSHE